ncbi:hypothetical protein [Clostridium perfringens]|uniref:hypothetical protein n=1 Tax=Clostridium perfringens TaxID=1502 RepID=UPI001A1CCCF2|nr:hypothetical protein [Clostridium perfringens]
MENITKRKILNDLILNIMASIVLTATLQIFVYPFISNSVGIIEFGSILTIIGISNALGSMFGVSLNNVHLLNQNVLKDEDLGNFKILLKDSSIIITVIMIIFASIFFKQFNKFNYIIICIVSVFTMLRSYLGVYYRIELNYRYIFNNSILTSIGFLIGIVTFKLIKIWALIFLVGELFSFIYFFKTTNFKKQYYKRTDKFDKIRSEYFQLVSSNSIANILIYLDRIVINPILGPANVSIYFISSFVGKMFAIVLQPIASIILTYISKLEKINPKKIFNLMIVSLTIFGVGAFLVSIPITPIIIKILYPEAWNEVSKYFIFANLAAILMTVGSLLQPLTLKYAPLWWQGVIQSIYGFIYFIGGIFSMIYFQLIGFCILTILANLIRFILLIIVSYKYCNDNLLTE